MLIADFFFDNCETCIHPELFSKSLISLHVSNLSKIITGRYFFLYISFTGYLKDGPCLKFTLLFFSVKKLIFSSALSENEKKN